MIHKILNLTYILSSPSLNLWIRGVSLYTMDWSCISAASNSATRERRILYFLPWKRPNGRISRNLYQGSFEHSVTKSCAIFARGNKVPTQRRIRKELLRLTPLGFPPSDRTGKPYGHALCSSPRLLRVVPRPPAVDGLFGSLWQRSTQVQHFCERFWRNERFLQNFNGNWSKRV